MNVAEKLDSMRNGAQKVIILIEGDLIDIRRALDGGDFNAAFHSAKYLTTRLQGLATAESTFVPLDKNDVVKVRDIVPGTVIVGMSEQETETVQRVDHEESDKVTLYFTDSHGEEQGFQFRGDQEVLVQGE